MILNKFLRFYVSNFWDFTANCILPAAKMFVYIFTKRMTQNNYNFQVFYYFCVNFAKTCQLRPGQTIAQVIETLKVNLRPK